MIANLVKRPTRYWRLETKESKEIVWDWPKQLEPDLPGGMVLVTIRGEWKAR